MVSLFRRLVASSTLSRHAGNLENVSLEVMLHNTHEWVTFLLHIQEVQS
jgi:hypothetical protein